MRSKVQLCVNSLAPSTAQYSLPSISAISSCSPGEPQAERNSASAATLNVRINMCFGLRSRMRHRTLIGQTDVLGIAPECSRLIIIGAWRQCSTPVCQYVFIHHQVDGASICIDGYHIPILHHALPASVFGSTACTAQNMQQFLFSVIAGL